ncbi:MAG: hypothetical protein NTV43_03405 [Methylococcales bacterium]|nr:hypothetical protein [Methylococcales bacterium]
MNSNLKYWPWACALIFYCTYAGTAAAHAWNNEVLGPTAGATDYFQVKCYNDGHGNASRLELQVNDDTPGTALLSLQVQKGLLAGNTTDSNGGDDIYSPLLAIAGGNGTYDVMVDKTTAASRQYDVSYHCMTKSNIHAGTSIVKKQNQ